MLTLLMLISCSDVVPNTSTPGGDGGGTAEDGGSADGGGTEYFQWIALRVFDADLVTECDVFFNLTDPESVPLEHWSFEDATPEADGQRMDHWGFMMPEDATLAVSEACADWNADVFGEIQDVVPDHAWGFGLGDLRVDVAEVVASPDFVDSTAAERLTNGEWIGGSWSSDMWEPATFASHSATGSPAANWVLEVDDEGEAVTYFKESDYVVAPFGIPDGVYVLNSVYLWDFATCFGAR